MSLGDADIAFVQELFANIPDLSTRKHLCSRASAFDWFSGNYHSSITEISARDFAMRERAHDLAVAVPTIGFLRSVCWR